MRRDPLFVSALMVILPLAGVAVVGQIGSERAVPVHLLDGQEFAIPLQDLIRQGEHLFTAMGTVEDCGG